MNWFHAGFHPHKYSCIVLLFLLAKFLPNMSADNEFYAGLLEQAAPMPSISGNENTVSTSVNASLSATPATIALDTFPSDMSMDQNTQSLPTPDYTLTDLLEMHQPVQTVPLDLVLPPPESLNRGFLPGAISTSIHNTVPNDMEVTGLDRRHSDYDGAMLTPPTSALHDDSLVDGRVPPVNSPASENEPLARPVNMNAVTACLEQYKLARNTGMFVQAKASPVSPGTTDMHMLPIPNEPGRSEQNIYWFENSQSDYTRPMLSISPVQAPTQLPPLDISEHMRRHSIHSISPNSANSVNRRKSRPNGLNSPTAATRPFTGDEMRRLILSASSHHQLTRCKRDLAILTLTLDPHLSNATMIRMTLASVASIVFNIRAMNGAPLSADLTDYQGFEIEAHEPGATMPQRHVLHPFTSWTVHLWIRELEVNYGWLLSDAHLGAPLFVNSQPLLNRMNGQRSLRRVPLKRDAISKVFQSIKSRAHLDVHKSVTAVSFMECLDLDDYARILVDINESIRQRENFTQPSVEPDYGNFAPTAPPSTMPLQSELFQQHQLPPMTAFVGDFPAHSYS